MRIGTALATAALAAAFPLASAGSSAAADLPYYYQPAAVPLTVGSGWYLRGDAAFGDEDRPKLVLRDNVPAFDRGGSQFGYAFGAGAGYRLNDWFRVDATGDYLDPLHYAATLPCGTDCAINQSTDVQRLAALANGYVDLGTYAGFTPYVGAGAGIGATFADGKIGIDGAPLASGVLDSRTGTLVTSHVPSRTDLRFAWAAMAGVSYLVTPHTLVDIGYRYLDLGRTTISLFPAATVTRTLSTQEVRVGLRYMID